MLIPLGVASYKSVEHDGELRNSRSRDTLYGMNEYASAERRAWARHYFENGQNAAATARHFGITRATLYRWLKRYDPSRPSRPLRSRSRRRHTTPRPKWGEMDLKIVAELDMRFRGNYGAGRLSKALSEDYEIEFSRATVGRMLVRVRRRCPICKGRGKHEEVDHVFAHDMRPFWERVRRREELERRLLEGYRAGHRQPGTGPRQTKTQ